MIKATRRLLYLVVEGLSEAQKPPISPGDDAEVFVLTEANAAEALPKIFAAEGVSVWGEVNNVAAVCDRR